jgi:hypothetical protein
LGSGHHDPFPVLENKLLEEGIEMNEYLTGRPIIDHSKIRFTYRLVLYCSELGTVMM